MVSVAIILTLGKKKEKMDIFIKGAIATVEKIQQVLVVRNVVILVVN